MSDTRWMVERLYINDEEDILQHCVVHPAEVNKEAVKREHPWYHKRTLLLPDQDSYRIG